MQGKGDRRNARVIFVTGTDTGVGKTRVAAALLHNYREAGLRCAALKPVAAGADASLENTPCNSDALQLMQQANAGQGYADINPVLLEQAIAPHIAAERSERQLTVDTLLPLAHRALVGADVLVVEGAGGWLVPLNATETLADFAVRLQAEVLLVVGIRLGCLNHALLSAAAIRDSGCRLTAWVANCIEPDMPELEANIDALRQRLPVPLLGKLAWQPGQEVVDFAAELASLPD